MLVCSSGFSSWMPSRFATVIIGVGIVAVVVNRVVKSIVVTAVVIVVDKVKSGMIVCCCSQGFEVVVEKLLQKLYASW